MATRIIHRRGKGIPTASEFASVGEILIDTQTGTGYTLREPDGAVVALGGDGSGTGAGMVISPTEPTDPVDGMQWLDSTTARVWVWDENKWLEFPAASSGGDGSGLIEVSEEPPGPPYEIGQQWFSSTDGYLYVWYGAEWVAVNMKSSSGGGGDEGDPDWSKVALLINADDEADGSQNIVDATNSKYITVVNDSKVSTAVYKYGTGSVEFNDSCLTTDSMAPIGTNQFCVEAWIWVDDYNPNTGIFQFVTAPLATETTSRPGVHLTSGAIRGELKVYGWGTNYATGFAFETEKWVHIALSRGPSNILRVFVDGILIHEDVDESSFDLTSLQFGRLYNKNFTGYMDDMRVTVGRPRYTANFTPPEKHPTKEAIKRAIVIQKDIPQAQEDSNDADLS